MKKITSLYIAAATAGILLVACSKGNKKVAYHENRDHPIGLETPPPSQPDVPKELLPRIYPSLAWEKVGAASPGDYRTIIALFGDIIRDLCWDRQKYQGGLVIDDGLCANRLDQRDSFYDSAQRICKGWTATVTPSWCLNMRSDAALSMAEHHSTNQKK